MVKKSEQKNKLIARPPVVAIMGHIDHGKSKLLDYIRKTNIVDAEAGGITQHVSAYEVEHKTKEGKDVKITFLDTPGHEAFNSIRVRGATIADIAILVVSAEDGVKAQTLDALKCITASKVPYIVAITKIDKDGADIERAKQSLAENEIYLEGYGGNIPFIPLSSITGDGVDDLLDMIDLVAELEELKGDQEKDAEGVLLEANVDSKKGISGTLIIKDGTLKKGQFAVCGESFAPLRIVEDFKGKAVSEATFSSPIKVIGWSSLPKIGCTFSLVKNKKEAEELANKNKTESKDDSGLEDADEEVVIVPLIIKADTAGSLEAIEQQLDRVQSEKVRFKIIHKGIGAITENDVNIGSGKTDTIIVGFHVKKDRRAETAAEKLGIEIYEFEIIYKLVDELSDISKRRSPKVEVEEKTGEAKILKFFSRRNDRQIVGGKVVSGKVSVGDQVKILRRGNELGFGKVRGLQKQKEKSNEVSEGSEFGADIEAKVELAQGDTIEAIVKVTKQIHE